MAWGGSRFDQHGLSCYAVGGGEDFQKNRSRSFAAACSKRWLELIDPTNTDRTQTLPAESNAPAAYRDILDRLSRREDILGNVSPAEREEIIRHGTIKKFRSGELVFSQGIGHTYTYFILRGVVRTSYISHNSKEYTVAYWSKGDLVGGPYFINDSTTYLWSGYAVEPIEVLAISGTALRALALRIPSLAIAMLDALCFKLHWFSLLLQMMGTQSVEGRLGILLLGLGTAYGVKTDDGLLIRYAFTQSDLAKMIGVSRQWVNNALGHFQKKGALTIVKGRFLIRNELILKESLGPTE